MRLRNVIIRRGMFLPATTRNPGATQLDALYQQIAEAAEELRQKLTETYGDNVPGDW
jgi:hypothetical protein